MSDPSPSNPYAAPLATPGPPPSSLPTAPATGPYGPFRDTRNLARTVIILLWIGFAAEFITYTLFGFELWLLDSPRGDAYLEGVTHEWLTQALGSAAIIQILFYLITIIFFAVWINRSCKNAWLFQSADRQGMPSLRALGSNSMTITPGWAVGYYFIPIVNLWRPYTAMREIRDASGPGKLTAVLPFWWTLWIAANLIGNISMRMPTETIPQYITSSIFDLVTAPVSLGSNVLAVLLVAGITRLQNARRPGQVTEPGQP